MNFCRAHHRDRRPAPAGEGMRLPDLFPSLSLTPRRTGGLGTRRLPARLGASQLHPVLAVCPGPLRFLIRSMGTRMSGHMGQALGTMPAGGQRVLRKYGGSKDCSEEDGPHFQGSCEDGS